MLIGGLASSGSVWAQREGAAKGLPISDAVQFMLKAVALHRSKATDQPGAFVVAIVHAPEVSGDLVRDVRAAFQSNQAITIRGKALETIEITFSDPVRLKKELLKAKAAAVYITADSRSITRAVLNVTRDIKILSITAEPDYVHWLGASLGVESRAGKPKLLINLSGCKNEGIEFDARLLQLASVYF
jgi:hypothetical protein